MSSWHSPQSIYNLGHRALTSLLDGPIQIEEKVDGSFIAFGVYEENVGNEQDGDVGELRLRIRSKGAELYVDAPDKMFSKGVAEIVARQASLIPGYQYRGEYLAKPKHNALAYDRVPAGNIILFDVCTAEETYLSYNDKAREASTLGFGCVPLLWEGNGADFQYDGFQKLLTTPSILGGQMIEGVVVKNYTQYGPDKKALFGKFVSEAFKEVHTKAWGESNPTAGDVIERMIQKYGTQARWQKAVQHLTEAGKLVGEPRDIGLLMKEIPMDVWKECAQDITDEVMEWAAPHIKRGLTRGMPDWYKQLLARQQFTTNEGEVVNA